MKFVKLRFREAILAGGGLIAGAAITLATGLHAQVPGPTLQPGGTSMSFSCPQYHAIPYGGLPLANAAYPTISITSTEHILTPGGGMAPNGQILPTGLTRIVLQCSPGAGH